MAFGAFHTFIGYWLWESFKLQVGMLGEWPLAGENAIPSEGVAGSVIAIANRFLILQQHAPVGLIHSFGGG